MLDIIEIDGASNNGVENVRDLIERAKFEPNQGQYKIYIIDEVHMLSTGAFNALLKILEEPPTHVKFILATTEVDKVPETIRSRTLRFDFKKITLENIIDRLHFVIESEGISAEEEALKIIAKTARGGLRDALTLLEQNIIDNEVSTVHVRYTLSLVDEALLEKIIECLKMSDVTEIARIIVTLKERHIQVRSFFDQLMYRLRDLMMEHMDDADFFIYSEIMHLLEEAYTRIRILPDGLMLIEITLLRIAKRGAEKSSNGTPPPVQTKTVESTPKNTPPQAVIEKKVEKISIEPLPEAVKTPKSDDTKIAWSTNNIWEPTKVTETPSTKTFSFPALINGFLESNPALTTDLKLARFSLAGNTLTLIFAKKWNFDRVNTPKIRNLIGETCESIFSGKWEVLCELKEWSSSNIVDWVF